MTDASGVYLALKLAKQLYDKSLSALSDAEKAKLDRVAARQAELEALILGAPEAVAVFAPPPTVEHNLAQIRGRYASEAEYLADLERVGLDEVALRVAVERDLRVEAVLERVGARAAQVSAVDVEMFWLVHRERWVRPESRVLRHILVTINDELAGSDRAAAHAKIEAIRARLLRSPERFEEQALKHSECPTAVNGGLLGGVRRGQLYPELESVAFVLASGELSPVIESSLGFHLVRSESIEPARHRTLAEARPAIRDHLEAHRRSACQKAWINALRRGTCAA